ncbi:hypothetical protein ZORO111903_13965 [Zobellia roscoffensis]|uniref:hypothetical protein n=1 Tax=Zobellia roscoffensis TaxID=2779508 RepID=UPI00188C8C1C|nr:hypothetical protein [Zobellia roscoffensis]
MKNLFFYFFLLTVIGCKQKKSETSTCDRDNCENCFEIYADSFTGFQSILCQDDDYDYEIVESMNDLSELCNVEGHFYKIKADDYTATKVECDGGRDYYIYNKN